MLLIKYDEDQVYEFKNFDKLEVRKFKKDDCGNTCSIDLIKNGKRIILKSYESYERASETFYELLNSYERCKRIFIL